MRKSLPRAMLVLFALLQLPFTYVGLSMALGYAQDGPLYFYDLHRSLSGTGQPLETVTASPVASAGIIDLSQSRPGAPKSH